LLSIIRASLTASLAAGESGDLIRSITARWIMIATCWIERDGATTPWRESVSKRIACGSTPITEFHQIYLLVNGSYINALEFS
jgi:hypothetical protein